MRPKFGKSIISMTDPHNFTRIRPEKPLVFESCSWFKFISLGLAQDAALKFYTIVAKRLKLKLRKFFGLNSTFLEVTREKTVRPFVPPNLNRVKSTEHLSSKPEVKETTL